MQMAGVSRSVSNAQPAACGYMRAAWTLALARCLPHVFTPSPCTAVWSPVAKTDRADERQHGRRPGFCGGLQGLQAGADHARHHVHRAARASQGPRGGASADRGQEGAPRSPPWARATRQEGHAVDDRGWQQWTASIWVPCRDRNACLSVDTSRAGVPQHPTTAHQHLRA